MNDSNSNQSKRKPLRGKFIALLIIRVALITVGILLGMLVLGAFLDQQFDTRPILRYVMLLLGVPLTTILVSRMARTAIVRAHAETEGDSAGNEEH
ncbi:MAG: AtpZ/AtpI family protein [Anaerolineaceae bacterium]|nr:AtpZ/AtpI family protein [Anaerolineaceae bacterium]